MRYENKALRDLARGAPCMFNLPGCDGGGETTVWVHSDQQWHGKGIGRKADDFFGAPGCAKCHASLPNLSRLHREEVMQAAMENAWAWMWREGLIQVTNKPAREPAFKRSPKIVPRRVA